MADNGIPDGTSPPPHDGGILGAVEQFAEKFLLRHHDAPPPPPPSPLPVIESQLANPPYAGMAHEVPGRYQQEVFGVRLNAAGPSVATFNFRTRADFITVTSFAVGATAPDANDGVWISLSGTPPSIPVLAPGIVQNLPYRVDAGETLTIHGAEQTISFTLDSTIDLVVIFVANTNVKSPY